MFQHKCQVNEYLCLELKDGYTYIYINDREISVCKHIAVDLTLERMNELERVDSVDDLSDRYKTTEREDYKVDRLISPEDEFFVHCSNIQAWAEQGYDTRLLHSNIAFPLLKELIEVGDLQAKRVFKEEIVKRHRSGSRKVQHYLADSGYLDLLTNAERELLFRENFQDIKQIEGLIEEKLEIVVDVNLKPGIELYKGRVEGLKIECRNLKIPYHIKNLHRLKKLILRSFADTRLPDWIGELSELELLDARCNQLEEIPNTIGKLIKLRRLYLGDNQIARLPKTVSNLQNLKFFHLYTNQFSKFPAEICALKKLSRLNLAGNRIESVPIEILNLKELFEIDLDFNSIEFLPLEIFNLPKLHFINLRGSKIKITKKTSELIKKRDLILLI